MPTPELAERDALADRFAAIVVEHADRVALRVPEGAVTYRALAASVAAERRRLTDLTPGTPVLVDLPGAGNSQGHVAALSTLLAVLTSGRVAVPIDGSLPEQRRRDIAQLVGTDPLPGCCLVMTTSGSTGTPKAVRHAPNTWTNQIDDIAAELQITPGTEVVLALPVSFGGGMDIVLGALFSGATLIPGDPRRDGVEQLLNLIDDVGAHQLHLSPALLRSLTARADASAVLASLRLVCTCGEAPDGADVQALRDAAPAATYVNRAGSSETGNLAWNIFPPERAIPTGTLPPGRIAAHKHIEVLDEHGQPVAPGEPGLLRVASDYLALGYLVDHQAVDFPIGERGREHQLGDTGRVIDGELFLLGRRDDAIKINGYLVDTSEVVAALRALPGIDDAVAIARENESGRKELHAYVQVAPQQSAPSPNVLRGLLGERLPVWMQPTHIVILDSLPRTERGKVDRQALPLPARRPEYCTLNTRTELLLAQLWEELLRLERIGASDDLLSLGADSLTIATLTALVEAAFGVAVAPARLAATPTLREQAALIDAETALPSGADLVELSPPGPASANTDRRTVIAIAGAGESALAFVPLARELDGVRVWGAQAHGLESRGIPDLTVEAAARRVVKDVLRTLDRPADPTQPLVLVGHSLGGAIALHAARLFADHGVKVEQVICLDTILSGPLGRHSLIEWSPAPEQPAPVVSAGPRRGRRRQLWRTRARLVTAGWWRRPADEQWTLFYELGCRMALLHRLRPHDGPVTALLAQGNSDQENWWRQLVPNGVTVGRIDGDHNSILRPPFVSDTAAAVVAAITTGSQRTERVPQ